MTKFIKLKKLLQQEKTLLGIGPMSVNIIDASIDIANQYDIPVMLIASRRQIDDENIQKGYVNNWSTREFAKYIRSREKNNNIIIARDHGGPWQNNMEIVNNYSIEQAMESATMSFKTDIEAGFDIIHIDPSIDISSQISFNEIFDRLADLYKYCNEYAQTNGKEIEFEVGTEEQMIHLGTLFEFSQILNKIGEFCFSNNFKLPLFVVSQIGTKVMEMKNIGLLNKENNSHLIKEIIDLCTIANEKNIHIKVHNTDYLSKDILKKFPTMKINAANVAPEFGVRETKTFIDILKKHRLYSLKNQFLELSFYSKKWQKWIIEGSNISDTDKAIICGHYIFANDEFVKIKELAQKKIDDDIDEILKLSIKNKILEYMVYFNMLNSEDIDINDFNY